MFKLDLEKEEETEIKLLTSVQHRKSKRVPEKPVLLFIDYAKTLDCMDQNKVWKILKEAGIPLPTPELVWAGTRLPPVSPERAWSHPGLRDLG